MKDMAIKDGEWKKNNLAAALGIYSHDRCQRGIYCYLVLLTVLTALAARYILVSENYTAVRSRIDVNLILEHYSR